jgi:quercetin dioxygenase-like cupin family protein
MQNDEPIRRGVLQGLAAIPLAALLARAGQAAAQPAGSPLKVDAEGLAPKIKFEAPLAGFLTDLNGKYKLRITELTLAPGGHIGEHNHVGPGIRQVTSGYMTYVLPEKTVVYGPGEFFFESGDINHTVFNKTNEPMIHLLFEILPADLNGPSLIPVKHH